MDIYESLMKAGFTRHEAMLYVTLCREEALTGYEAAKTSGIPRSNAYLALAGLVDKGGARRIDGDVTRYSAVPADELVFNLRRDMEQVYKFIEENAPVSEAVGEPYMTITGKKNVIDKMCHVISSAAERIYISTSPKELGYVKDELKDARDRGLKVVVITSAGSDLTEEAGMIVYINDKQPGQIRLIADTSQVLTGEISETGRSNCLYSRNMNLVQLIKDSLSNEIKLIQLKK
jgi:sugar-specific transcriptional regulator TrmB